MTTGAQERWRRGASIALLIACFGAVGLAYRLLMVVESDLDPQWIDGLGALADGSLAFLLASAALAASRLARVGRTLAVLVGVVWVFLNHANYEHFRALGGPVSLSRVHFLGDPTFLWGSAFAFSHKEVLLGLLVGLGVTQWWSWRSGAVSLRLRWLVLAALPGIAIAWIGPRGVTWRTSHFLLANVHWLTKPTPAAEGGKLEGFFPGSLSGTLRFDRPASKPNVLLVILEGVSGQMIYEAHDRRGPLMPRLAEITRHGVHYPNFIVQQRGTNRGTYALLCGDLPRLTAWSPKMTDLAGRARRDLDCLPQRLRRMGYSTHYLQAAALSFMGKDRFMPRAGFEEVAGKEWLEDGYANSTWGIDDRAFLEQSLRKIEEVDKTGKPWFLTLLTVGTHHPFTLPSKHGTGRRERHDAAFAYLDSAVGSFMEALHEHDVLDSTAVILTSDEATARRGSQATIAHSAASQAWGFLIVLLPSGVYGPVTEAYGQSDLALSILDLLGAEQAVFSGRSVFRAYRTPRAIPYGNIAIRRVGMLDEEKNFLVCEEDLTRCEAYAADPEAPYHLSGVAERPRIPDYDRVTWLWRAIRRSLSIDDRAGMSDFYELLADRKVDLGALSSGRIMGGQFLTVAERSVVDVELAFRVEGDLEFELTHFLWTAGATKYRKNFKVRDGTEVAIDYTFRPRKRARSLTCNLRVVPKGLPTPGVKLHFDVARLRIRPATGDDPAGIHVRTERVSSGKRRDGSAKP